MDFVDVPKQIQFVGSCATLIAEQIRHADNTFFESSKEACEMLLATILIDTYNLDPHGGRTTNMDKSVVKMLSEKNYTDSNQLFTTIQRGLPVFLNCNVIF